MCSWWDWFTGGYSESRIRFSEFMAQMVAMRRSLAGLDDKARRLIDVVSSRAGQAVFRFGLATEQPHQPNNGWWKKVKNPKSLYPYPKERLFMAVTITTTQQVEVSVKFVDRRGNEAPVDGIPEWLTDNISVLDLEPSDDGESCLVRAIGIPGSAKVQVSADADLGDGVTAIVGTVEINVVPAPAISVELNVGEVQEQPDL